LINVFGYIDVDGGGEVTIKEIMNWGRVTRGKPYTPAELKHIMSEYDEDGNGVITLDEWIHYHENMHKHPHLNPAAEEFSHVDDKILWERSSKLFSTDASDASDPTFRLDRANSNSLGLDAPKTTGTSDIWGLGPSLAGMVPREGNLVEGHASNLLKLSSSVGDGAV